MEGENQEEFEFQNSVQEEQNKSPQLEGWKNGSLIKDKDYFNVRIVIDRSGMNSKESSPNRIHSQQQDREQEMCEDNETSKNTQNNGKVQILSRNTLQVLKERTIEDDLTSSGDRQQSRQETENRNQNDHIQTQSIHIQIDKNELKDLDEFSSQNQPELYQEEKDGLFFLIKTLVKFKYGLIEAQMKNNQTQKIYTSTLFELLYKAFDRDQDGLINSQDFVNTILALDSEIIDIQSLYIMLKMRVKTHQAFRRQKICKDSPTQNFKYKQRASELKHLTTQEDKILEQLQKKSKVRVYEKDPNIMIQSKELEKLKGSKAQQQFNLQLVQQIITTSL